MSFTGMEGVSHASVQRHGHISLGVKREYCCNTTWILHSGSHSTCPSYWASSCWVHQTRSHTINSSKQCYSLFLVSTESAAVILSGQLKQNIRESWLCSLTLIMQLVERATTMLWFSPALPTGVWNQEVITAHPYDIVFFWSLKTLPLNYFFLQIFHCSPLLPHWDSRHHNSHCTSHLAQHQPNWICL